MPPTHRSGFDRVRGGRTWSEQAEASDVGKADLIWLEQVQASPVGGSGAAHLYVFYVSWRLWEAHLYVFYVSGRLLGVPDSPGLTPRVGPLS